MKNNTNISKQLILKSIGLFLQVLKLEKIFKQNPREHNIMFGINYLSSIINYFHVNIPFCSTFHSSKENVMFTDIKLFIDLCSHLKRKKGLENRVRAG